MAELTGKVLGIAVAMEVMGWTEVGLDDPAAPPDGPYPRFWERPGNFEELWVLESCGPRGRNWSPWRDMNDAWEVVELFLSRGYEVVVSGGFSRNLSACMIYKGFAAPYPPRDTFLHLWSIDSPLTEELRIPSYREQAPTVCEAILQTALAAVRDKKEATC